MKMNKEVVMVRISDIIPNRFQPRLTFDEEALNELANSIREHGIIQPLILRDLGSKYEIIAGERRYKASQIAGLTEVPAIVGTMDDQTSAELALIENIQRKDLSAIEEAKSYIENFGRLYVYVTGSDPYEHGVNWIVTIYELKNNNTLINIDTNTTNYHIEWTSSQIELVMEAPL